MSEKLRRFQDRQLARSGKFNGWSAIVFVLQFEEGFTEAMQWTYCASTQEELDNISRATKKHTAASAKKIYNHRSKSLWNFAKKN